MSSNWKLNRAKSNTSSSSQAVAAKAKDFLEGFILEAKKEKRGLKGCRNKEETKEVEEIRICNKKKKMTEKPKGAQMISSKV